MRSPPSVAARRVLVEQPRRPRPASMRPRSRARRSSSTSRATPFQRAARPGGERHREAHLRPRRGSTRGSRSLHRLAQDALGREARQLPLVGQRRGELDQLVIEERHAALDRRRHAHLVLLHQQLDQVGLDVGVEQPIEQRAAAVRRVEVARATRRRRRSRVAARAQRGDEQRALVAPAGSPRSCRRTSPPACAPWRGTSAARSARRVRAARHDALGDPAAARLPAARARRRAPARQFKSDARVLAVAGEQLVAAFAGEHDLDVLARERRDEVERHARRVRDRLVLVPDQPRQRAEEVAGRR